MEKLTVHSTIAEALQNEKAVEVIENFMPGITKNPAVKMFQKLTLDKLPHMSKLGLSAEKLDEMLKEINGD